MNARLLLLVVLLSGGLAQRTGAEASAAAGGLTHGPMVGHADATRAKLWARFAREGVYSLVVFDAAGNRVATAKSEALPGNDYCVVWQVAGLAPGRRYHYTIGDGRAVLAEGEDYQFRTAPADGAPARVRLAFGSCAHDQRFPSQPVWSRLVAEGAEVVVSLGDTPYIDSTDIVVQRRRYRELYGVPELRWAVGRTPYVATWDDHDFGRNDADGAVPGKEHSRQAFIEYHANPSYGDGEHEGVYTRFRWGPVEVFLLDTRWYADTRVSPVAADRLTLLGRTQWEWLRRGLKASTATFKILASGMVWNDAVRPNKPDHWMSYSHEREALFRFIGENRIPGVVLMGGDIHRSRALRYPTEKSAGYPLTELIASPMANRVIATANVASPHLLHDAGVEQSFILLTADTTTRNARLQARCMDHEGHVHFTVDLAAADLRY